MQPAPPAPAVIPPAPAVVTPAGPKPIEAPAAVTPNENTGILRERTTSQPAAQPAPTMLLPVPPATASNTPSGSTAGRSSSGDANVRPAAATGDTRSTFDVDFYQPKANDTYESISKLHYGDAKYAAALRTFNKGAELGRTDNIQVPPMYVLRKGGAQPVSRTADQVRTPAPTTDRTEWTPASGRVTPESESAATYTISKTGMTMWDVAEETLGDRSKWRRLWELNPSFDPNDLPAGTKLKLPSDAKAKKP
ncbi:LysM peptidoglycan-binding domain-containing protein [Fimbriiglobus ruber]|uniref:LysM peptidoglycan-binding domain-containing protein n=1 Tax=Fimbriiglobus ruber TaxID=1908690 RepID=UPI00137A5F56|nr:LysM peptidoglycan-binding domain-containing protein [Fimbriiglobus ruber]